MVNRSIWLNENQKQHGYWWGSLNRETLHVVLWKADIDETIVSVGT